MYLGGMLGSDGASITRLDCFLSGYSVALYEHGITDQDVKALFPLPFCFFNEYVAHYFKLNGTTLGWCNIILEQTGFDEQKGFYKFYELFDKFKKLTIKSCEKISLNEENITFHNTDEFAPRSIVGPNLDIEEPVFNNPEAVFIIKLTDNAGYLLLVNTSTSHDLEHWIFKSKQQVKEHIRTYFGNNLPDLVKIEAHELTLDKDLILR